MSGAKPTPENIVRNRTPIPSAPDKKDVRGLKGEISRVRSINQELEIVLQKMVDVFVARDERIWRALEILDKRFSELEEQDSRVDTVFQEKSRVTQQRERTVRDKGSNVEIDVIDVITQELVMKGTKHGTLIKLLFDESALPT